MDVTVYIREKIPYALDEIEDAIEDALGDQGEVTGSGTGTNGSNFDVDINDEELDAATVVARIRNALKGFQLPPPSVIIIDRIEYPLQP